MSLTTDWNFAFDIELTQGHCKPLNYRRSLAWNLTRFWQRLGREIIIIQSLILERSDIWCRAGFLKYGFDSTFYLVTWFKVRAHPLSKDTLWVEFDNFYQIWQRGDKYASCWTDKLISIEITQGGLTCYTVDSSFTQVHMYLIPRFYRFASSRKNIKSQTPIFHHISY